MRLYTDTPIVRFTLDPGVQFDEVVDTLELSRLAAGILHGVERVELEAPCELDAESRSVAIDTSTDAGRTLATIFLGFVRREFGAGAVRLEPLVRQTAGAV